MSRRLASLGVFFAVLISAGSLAQTIPTQPPQAGSSGASAATYSVDGVVINSATGGPVRAALVQMQAPARRSVLTGADGKFHFEGVPESQLTLTARKPGFFSEQELWHGATRSETLQVGPNTPSVVLKLVPEGVIYGQVTDADGEAIENLPVKLIHAAMVNGQRTWQVRRPAQTNDEGEFRLFGLPPGTYYLKAGPSRTARARAGGNSPREQEGYPARFYGGGAGFDSAAAIPVGAGKQVRADVSLKAEVFYPISGTITGAPRGAPLNLQFFSQDGEALPSEIRILQAGSFAASLPAGAYVVKAHAQGGDGPPGFASRVVNVTGEAAGINLALAPTATIPVAVRLELTRKSSPGSYAKDRQPVNIALVSKEGMLGSESRGTSVEGPPEKRSLAIRNLEPGTYTARIRANGPWYVESARCGETNLFTGNLTVPSGGPGQPIELVLRDDFAAVNGSVSLDGHPAPGIVVLIPELNPPGAVTLSTDPSGRFQTGELPPGKYRAFAFDRADDLEYTNSEAMRKFSSAAQFVRLSPNGQATLNLELQKRGE